MLWPLSQFFVQHCPNFHKAPNLKITEQRSMQFKIHILILIGNLRNKKTYFKGLSLV